MSVDGPTAEPTGPDEAPPSLVPLAGIFLRLGLTAFGGPAAHIALMQQEFVERRKWLTKEQFLDRLGASNLVPGPSSTELAIHIGYRLAGVPGLAAAGFCFILPAFLLVLAIAWAYVRYGALPQVTGVLYGIKPVVIAIVVQALWNLGKTAVKSRFLAAVGIAATVCAFLAAPPLAILLAAGLAVGGGRWATDRKESPQPLLALLLLIGTLVSAPAIVSRFAGTGNTFGLQPLFWVFLKLGSVVYGSGYVLLAFLRSELVTPRGWLTSSQLLDSVAVGQVTPGPVFTTATFIGYLLAGPKGAVVATVGIFLPAFLFVALSGSLVPRLRKSAPAGAFLDGVNVASLALMAAVTWQLGRDALHDVLTIATALAGAVLLLRYRVNPGWLVLGGAAIGLVSLLFKSR